MTNVLVTKLKDDYIRARADKDTLKRDVLSTFIGSLQTYENSEQGMRELKDAVVYNLLQKRINAYNETINHLKQVGRDSSEQEQERDVLQQYMPDNISEEELRQVIEGIYLSLAETGKKAIGKIMDNLKKDYPSRYDPATAMGIINSIINK